MSKKRGQVVPVFDESILPEDVTPETLIAGVDEVGRGALFGPVFAGAVVFPVGFLPQLMEMGVRDSKQLSPKRRTEIAQKIRESASAYHVSFATVEEIDRLNILQASLLAMYRAVIKLNPSPALCFVDGKHSIPNLSIVQQNIIKGDQRSPVIAAASILAKVKRDELIIRLAEKYPRYDLATHKGYGTKKHLDALRQYGPTSQHRHSFGPCRLY